MSKKWIPVDERLPEDDKLKYVTIASCMFGCYTSVAWYDLWEPEWVSEGKVIAWMDIDEIPEPYKGNSDGE